jgi:hypothetical protein
MDRRVRVFGVLAEARSLQLAGKLHLLRLGKPIEPIACPNLKSRLRYLVVTYL